MASLYEEQIRAEDTAYALYTEHGSDSQAEAAAIFPSSRTTTAACPGISRRSAGRRAALDIPVIASLNGTTSEGWIEHARALEQAGAAAIELNVYSIPIDLAVSGAERRAAVRGDRPRGQVERADSRRRQARCRTSRSLPHMAAELVRAGADGLVLFNRFYAPDIDLVTLRVTRSLPLSTAAELPLSLVWIALLSRRLACSLAASRGVETDVEVVKYLLVGADVVTTASALLRHGPQHVATMRDGLERWLGENGFDSVDAIRGLKDATHVEHVDALLPRAIRRRPHRIHAQQARLARDAGECLVHPRESDGKVRHVTVRRSF